MTGNFLPPAIRTIRNAKVQSFRPPIVAPPPKGFRGGVVLGNFTQDRWLRHSRYWEPVDSFDENVIFDKTITGEYAYFGPISDHFGHMMAECIHRAIPSRILAPHRKFIFLGESQKSSFNSKMLPKFIQDLLLFFRLSDADMLFLNEDAIVEDLLICESGSDFGGGPKEGYLNYLDSYSKSRLENISTSIPSYEKVYVSRSKMVAGGSILGEVYMESLLENEGFYIFHPQEYSLFDQMKLYASSQMLVFSEGAACHGVELFGNRAIPQCYLLERRSDHREIFRRILQPRCQQYSSIQGTIPVASIVLDAETGTLLSNFEVVVLDCSKFVADFRTRSIATLSSFSRQLYQDSVRVDFSRYVSYHKNNGSRMLPDTEIEAIEQHMNRLL